MTYLYWTYVDAQTGISCLAAPMRNGPANPAVPGLKFGFALESRYPTPHPVFFGACPDDTRADALAVPGVLGVLTEAEYQQALTDELTERRAGMTCSKAQGKLELLESGLLDTVEAWIATQPVATQIEYADRSVWERNWPLVVQFAAEHGISDVQLDAMFARAVTR